MGSWRVNRRVRGTHGSHREGPAPFRVAEPEYGSNRVGSLSVWQRKEELKSAKWSAKLIKGRLERLYKAGQIQGVTRATGVAVDNHASSSTAPPIAAEVFGRVETTCSNPVRKVSSDSPGIKPSAMHRSKPSVRTSTARFLAPCTCLSADVCAWVCARVCALVCADAGSDAGRMDDSEGD